MKQEFCLWVKNRSTPRLQAARQDSSLLYWGQGHLHCYSKTRDLWKGSGAKFEYEERFSHVWLSFQQFFFTWGKIFINRDRYVFTLNSFNILYIIIKICTKLAKKCLFFISIKNNRRDISSTGYVRCPKAEWPRGSLVRYCSLLQFCAFF
jgi:hypothetical protein